MNLENGNPLLRANAHTCRDVAAMEAMQAAVKLTIMMAVMTFVAARFWVAL